MGPVTTERGREEQAKSCEFDADRAHAASLVAPSRRFCQTQKNDHHIYLIMAFCSGGDLSIYIKKRGRLPTLDFPRLLPDGSRPTQDSGGELRFWPHPEEGGLDGVVTRCFLGQLSRWSMGLARESRHALLIPDATFSRGDQVLEGKKPDS